MIRFAIALGVRKSFFPIATREQFSDQNLEFKRERERDLGICSCASMAELRNTKTLNPQINLAPDSEGEEDTTNRNFWGVGPNKKETIMLQKFAY